MAEEVFLLPCKGIHNAVFRQSINIEVVCPSTQECFVLGMKDFEPTDFFCVPFSVELPLGENEVLIFSVVYDFVNVLLCGPMMLM